MKIWKNTKIIAMLTLLFSGGCTVADTNTYQPKPLEGMKNIPVSEKSKELDIELSDYLRDEFSIDSAQYYHVASEIPWIAVSKSVQNQMAEKSIKKQMFEWYEPGLDFIEIYPQSNDTAFAIAMPKGTNTSSDKLVGFYILKKN